MKKLKILELFGGIGACSKALERLKIDYEIADYVEIDKYAVKSYNAMHNTNFEPQDITTWDKQIDVDLIMHGSPCQDFSLAGKQAGGDIGSGTRSSLMYETIRIVGKLRPKYVIWENVKNILSKKHIHNFESYLNTMKALGYTNYYQVLNAKDYGIPQNRERVFTISILNGDKYFFPKGDECENKIDIVGNYMPSCHDASRIVDENGLAPTVKENHGTVTAVAINYSFPQKQELKLKLKDMLEDEVDEKYYLSEKMKDYLYGVNQKESKFPRGDRFEQALKGPNEKGIANTISTLPGNRPVDNFVIHNKALKETLETNEIDNGVSYIDSYNRNIRNDDLSGTITTRVNDSNNTYLAIKNATKKGYLEATDGDGVVVIDKTICLNSKGGRNGIEGLQPSRKDRIYDSEGIATTIATSEFYNPSYTDNLRIRKLTPKECWRLMGFDDEDFEKAEKVNSNSQLYKQAGNSIVVQCLEAIFRNLFKEI